MTFTFIDLFAGIGGFRIGFEAAGGECVFSSEYDKYSQLTYQAFFGEKPVFYSRNKNGLLIGSELHIFKISVNSLADIAILSVEVDSISISEVIVDSRSEELKVSLLLFISNKKLSRIGRVFVELMIPPKVWISL